MDFKEQAEKAIMDSFKAEIKNMYSVFSNAVAAADNDQNKIKKAKERFKKGYEIAKQVYTEAESMIS